MLWDYQRNKSCTLMPVARLNTLKFHSIFSSMLSIFVTEKYFKAVFLSALTNLNNLNKNLYSKMDKVLRFYMPLCTSKVF